MSEVCILAHLEANVPPRARRWSLPNPDQSLSDRSRHRPALLPPGQPVFSRRTLRKACEVPMVQMGKLRLREAELLNQGVQTPPHPGAGLPAVPLCLMSQGQESASVPGVSAGRGQPTGAALGAPGRESGMQRTGDSSPQVPPPHRPAHRTHRCPARGGELGRCC